MKKQLEIATIKANSSIFQGCELFWLVSRSQLEFLFREVELVGSMSSGATAKYQDIMLPVVNLEKYYGLEEKDGDGPVKYLVIRSVDKNNELVKLIVQTPETLKIQKLETEFEALQSPAFPKNSECVLGAYSLGTGRIGVVPDFVGMNETLLLGENQNQ